MAYDVLFHVLWNPKFFLRVAQGDICSYNHAILTGYLLKRTSYMFCFVLFCLNIDHFILSSVLILGSVSMRPVKGTGLYRKEPRQVLIMA